MGSDAHTDNMPLSKQHQVHRIELAQRNGMRLTQYHTVREIQLAQIFCPYIASNQTCSHTRHS